MPHCLFFIHHLVARSCSCIILIYLGHFIYLVVQLVAQCACHCSVGARLLLLTQLHADLVAAVPLCSRLRAVGRAGSPSRPVRPHHSLVRSPAKDVSHAQVERNSLKVYQSAWCVPTTGNSLKFVLVPVPLRVWVLRKSTTI